MLPAGYETKKEFLFDEDFYDDEDDFEFDFGDNISNSNLKKNVLDLNSNENQKPLNEKSLSQSNSSIKSNDLNNNQLSIINNSNNILYNLNQKYYYNEFDFIINDLKKAILEKNLSLIQKLFEKHNINVNCKLKTNWAPLMYSVSNGSYEITKYLIDKGANVNFDDDTFTVLMCACGSNDPAANEESLVKIIELLIGMGADVNSADKYCQTPLIYASRSGRADLVECLVKFKADINARDDNDWTSLHHASHKGQLKVVQTLLKLGADPLIYTFDYLYPFDLAENSGFSNIKLLLKRYLKVKKFESEGLVNKNIKESNFKELALGVICEFDQDENDEFDGKYLNDDDEDDGLVTFLSGLKLKNLIKLFKEKKILFKTLLNFTDADLKNIGILDGSIRRILLDEINRFHKANWKSTSLIPARDDLNINCNEALAIISNISRCIDFMSTNIKYISSEAKDINKEIFADEYINAKLIIEIKKVTENSEKLLSQIDSLSTLIEKEVVSKTALPIDAVKAPSWYKKPLIVSSTIGIILGSIFLLNKKQ